MVPLFLYPSPVRAPYEVSPSDSLSYLYNRGKRIIEKRLEVSITNADIPLLMGYPQNKKTRNFFL